MTKTLIARIDTFTKQGRYAPRGTTVTSDEVDYDPDAENNNVIEAPEGVGDNAVVQISAIAPTGPNPTVPQQIAPDVVQTTGGYEQAGARLVSEVTVPEKVRFEIIDPEDDTQAKVTEALANADLNNNDDALVEGTVADVVAGINADTSDEDLSRLLAAENDREKPRSGVTRAIEAEQARRASEA